MILHTYSQPYDFIERSQVRRSDFVMCLHWDVAIDLRVATLRTWPVMEMQSSGRRWLWMMARHHDQ